MFINFAPSSPVYIIYGGGYSETHDCLGTPHLSPLAGFQFQRCLSSHFGVTLSEDEQRGVLRKYDTKGTGMVNYREFCATVDNGVCVCVCVCVHVSHTTHPPVKADTYHCGNTAGGHMTGCRKARRVCCLIRACSLRWVDGAPGISHLCVCAQYNEESNS